MVDAIGGSVYSIDRAISGGPLGCSLPPDFCQFPGVHPESWLHNLNHQFRTLLLDACKVVAVSVVKVKV